MMRGRCQSLLEKLGFKKRPVNYYKKTRGLPAGGYLCPEKVIEAGMGGSRGKFLDSLISEPGADKKISDIKDILNIHKAIRALMRNRTFGPVSTFLHCRRIPA